MSRMTRRTRFRMTNDYKRTHTLRLPGTQMRANAVRLGFAHDDPHRARIKYVPTPNGRRHTANTFYIYHISCRFVQTNGHVCVEIPTASN